MNIENVNNTEKKYPRKLITIKSNNSELNKEIKRLQTISINVWPSKYFFFLNGWILRFSDDLSNRSNSVLPSDYYGSNLREDIEFVEKIFNSYRRVPKFVIHNQSKPTELEKILVKNGYIKEQRILDVMSCKIANFISNKGNQEINIVNSQYGDNSWFEFMSQNKDVISKQTLNQIKIPTKQFLSAKNNYNNIIGAIFAVLDPHGNLYIANLLVAKSYRRKRVSTSLISHLITWGIQHQPSAKFSFLHVDSRNHGAISMYKRMGFERLYSYCYYSKK
ncbi:MAG: GNAT family N-acetyltransferase [Candidatus Hodarchaeales archaeon]